MLADLRAAWRSLAKSPRFVVVAILALGLGLGLSTTMFGVLDAVLNPVRAFANQDRLFWVSPRMSGRASHMITQYELYSLIREKTRSFDAILPVRRDLWPVSVGSDAREFPVAAVSPDWFAAVGVRPIVGRTFSPSDGGSVAVVSSEVWRFLSEGRGTIRGAKVNIDERMYSVVGVLPRGAGLWGAVIPLPPDEERSEHISHLLRLAPGVTPSHANAELKALAEMLTARVGTPDAPWGLLLSPFWQEREEVRDIHLAMVGAALVVLLIGCVNLAHLMAMRGLAKRRELAIRMALGAGRVAAVRIMLAESLLIVTGGMALGTVVAIWGARLLTSIMPPEVSWIGLIQPQMSWRVFVLGAATAAIAGVTFGVMPAARVALRLDLTEPLKAETGTTTGAARLRYSPLVIVETALALSLLMASMLLARSVHQLEKASPGFDSATLVDAFVSARVIITDRAGRPDTTTVDWPQALDIARRVPGVSAVALFDSVVARGGALTAEQPGERTRLITTPTYTVVSPDYLHVLGLPVLHGRSFLEGDAAGDGVAVLSSVAAERLYPRIDAVGHMVKLGSPQSSAPWIRIVGVARTPIAPWDPQEPPAGRPIVWVARQPGRWGHADLVVRVRNRSPQTLVGLRHALRTLPSVYFVRALPYDWARDSEIASRAFLARVFLALGGVGLVLAAFGLYAVLSYAVSRRTRELAVRVALGAEASALFKMVLHDGLVMLLAGTGLGAFGALACAYLFNTVLIGVYPADALSLLLSEIILLAVGLAAALAPAIRATRAAPNDILRAV